MLNPQVLDCFMSGLSLHSLISTNMELTPETPQHQDAIIVLPPTPRHAQILVRPWTSNLGPTIAASANNRAIWLQLRDRMPHPYKLSDAEWYIDHCSNPEHWPNVLTYSADGTETVGPKKNCHFAIVTEEDEAIGSIGLVMGTDVARRSAEIGYWLAEAYWGQGIMQEVVRRFVEWAWEAFPGLIRVHAEIFAANERSASVLRRVGFEYEGRQRAATWKDGKIGDTLMFAIVRPGLAL